MSAKETPVIETLHLLADAFLGAGTLFVWYRARRRSEGRTGDFARVLTQTLAQASAKGYTAEFTDDAFHLYYERWNKALLEKTRVTVLRIARADLDAGRFEHRCPVGGEELAWRLVDEDAPLAPRSLYAASKTAQEHYALAWSESAGGAVVALRYHNVYGPGMPRDTPYSGVAAIFRSSLEKGQPPRVFEDGGQMRDFVHVDDVAAANVAAVGSDGGGFLAANVCSGRPISIMDVASRLCEARGGPAPVVTGQYRSGDVRHIVADPARDPALRQHLAKKGFDPLMGARPMQRLIQDTIRRALADELLFGRLVDGGRLTVDIEAKTDDKGQTTSEVKLDITPLPKKSDKTKTEEATAE